MNPYTGEVRDLLPEEIKQRYREAEGAMNCQQLDQLDAEREALRAQAQAEGFVPIPPNTPEEDEILRLLQSGQTHADLSGRTPLANWARAQRNKKAKARARRKSARAHHQKLRRMQ